MYYNGELVRYSSIDKTDVKDGNQRLRMMISEVMTLIEREAPDVVVVEETVVTRNPQTQRMLSMILGAILGVCVSYGFAYCALRPTQWRKAVRGEDEKLPRKREELKKWSVDKVIELFGINEVNDDVSDAILIGMAFINMMKE